MGTPLGDFIRTKRDSIQPETLGLPERGRRRSPGLRRLDLAARAGISVEYLTRIEQGRDRNPSIPVVNALADALSLDPAERSHLRYLAKITGGECTAHPRPAPPRREVRPSVLRTLELLEPGIAVVTNRLGDILAHTSGFATLTSGTGLLDTDARTGSGNGTGSDARNGNGTGTGNGNGIAPAPGTGTGTGTPNLTRYVFTDPRARAFFADWDDVADEQAFDLWLGPSVENSEWLSAELAPVAGPDFTSRLNRHVVPQRGTLRLNHPAGPALRFIRETLDVAADAQQIVVFLPADEETTTALAQLRERPKLRAIS
ncbi:helix-turn-helix domain-containing protein [Streptomyces actinomycinicus]|uniref:Helix-turn-helix domain-containing protein n=1 Tax=Streptomyces actinomycinicus TaxID=1695166 RepID=A0A937JP28_9ACTN|nr:helix-turn-helix transcriptional regulator [Streptomyces actinomycinicus]MBL1086394.1 helix-turn-helix domain-containing protein [Streptomyces actinomycinicus]